MPNDDDDYDDDQDGDDDKIMTIMAMTALASRMADHEQAEWSVAAALCSVVTSNCSVVVPTEPCCQHDHDDEYLDADDDEVGW